MQGGFTSYNERIDASKIRARSKSFFDHFRQARLFFNSQSEPEKNHIVDAFSFELGKVVTKEIRERMLGILSLIDKGLATQVAYKLGLHVPASPEKPINHVRPADAAPGSYEPIQKESQVKESSALSMASTVKDSIRSRMIAFLLADGVDAASVIALQDALMDQGAIVDIVAPRLGTATGEDDTIIPVKQSFLTSASVMYDAIYIPGGSNSVATLAADPDAIHFINEAYRHCKAIAAHPQADQVLQETYFYKKLNGDVSSSSVAEKEGVIIQQEIGTLTQLFTEAIKKYRFWEREPSRKIPA